MKTIETNHEYRIDLESCPLEVELDQALSHQDALADRFAATLRRGMIPADLTGASAVGYMTFQTTRQTLPLEGTVSGSTAEVTLTADCYAVPGPFTLVLQVSSGEVRHSVLRVKGSIDRSATDEVISSGELLPTLPELLAQIGDMQSATEDSREAAQESREAAAETLAALDECRSVLTDAAAQFADTAPPIITAIEGGCCSAADAASARTLPQMRLCGMSTQAAAPTPDAPAEIVSVGDAGSVTLEVCGRNLYDLNNLKQPANTNAQSTCTVTEDGWIDVTSQKTYDYLYHDRFFAAGVPYTARYEVEVYDRPADSTGNTVIGIGIGVQQTKHITANGSYTYVVNVTPETSGVLSVRTMANVGSAVPAKVRFRVTCVAGTYTAATMPAWEAYNAQKLTLPYTLRGIPVASGGNYTDADGQQWIADEIDFARGVHVQRVKALQLDGDSALALRVAERGCFYHGLADAAMPVGVAEKAPVMCTHLTPRSYSLVLSSNEDNTCAARDAAFYINLPDEYNTVALASGWLAEHPLEALYALTEPVETPLSAQALAVYAALRSQPGMTVTADGAHVYVRYVADTKAYIDRKFDELAQAIGGA